MWEDFQCVALMQTFLGTLQTSRGVWWGIAVHSKNAEQGQVTDSFSQVYHFAENGELHILFNACKTLREKDPNPTLSLMC